MHEHCGADRWTKCTLCRTNKQSRSVLDRAKQRSITWPKQKQHGEKPLEDPAVFTTIDDAFSNVMQYMSTTSRQCKRYYRSCSPNTIENPDQHHCDRFHTPSYAKVQHNNPLQRAEDVHMVVHPGTYAVTAGEWGTTRQQTHVVHMEPGQNLDLDFML